MAEDKEKKKRRVQLTLTDQQAEFIDQLKKEYMVENESDVIRHLIAEKRLSRMKPGELLEMM